jgi:hypothetical protein
MLLAFQRDGPASRVHTRGGVMYMVLWMRRALGTHNLQSGRQQLVALRWWAQCGDSELVLVTNNGTVQVVPVVPRGGGDNTRASPAARRSANSCCAT